MESVGKFWNARPGLRKMYIAEVGILICSVLVFIPGVNMFAALAAIVFAIINLIGLFQTGKDIEGCRTAFIVSIVQIAVNVIKSVLGNSILGAIAGLAVTIMNVLVIYFVCISVSEVMEQIGNLSVAKSGLLTWKVNLACYCVIFATGMCALIPGFGMLASIGSILSFIALVVASVVYLVFLSESSKVFQGQ